MTLSYIESLYSKLNFWVNFQPRLRSPNSQIWSPCQTRKENRVTAFLKAGLRLRFEAGGFALEQTTCKRLNLPQTVCCSSKSPDRNRLRKATLERPPKILRAKDSQVFFLLPFLQRDLILYQAGNHT